MRKSLLIVLLSLLISVSCTSTETEISGSLETKLDVLVETTSAPPPIIITLPAASASREVEIEQTVAVDEVVEKTAPTQTEPVAPAISQTVAGPTGTTADSATLAPTFTAPASPETSAWDHYWLRRPVPTGDAVWTDKAYPFGASRGGTLRPHHGVEFNVSAGTDVMASADGTVFFAGNDEEHRFGPETDFYGNVIVIEHGFLQNGQPVFTLYGHLSDINVQVGQAVKSGDIIAQSGSSGVADGAHLHFEVRVGENSYQASRNPLLWLYPFPENGVVAGTVSWPDGAAAAEVPINLRRIDGPSSYSATTTYAADSVSRDLNWDENFALDDVSAGYYELTVGTGDSKEELELWVFPGITNFVEIVLSQG